MKSRKSFDGAHAERAELTQFGETFPDKGSDDKTDFKWRLRPAGLR